MSRYVFIQSASRLIFLILSHPHALILLPTRVSTRLNRKNTGITAPLILHLSTQPAKVIADGLGNLIVKSVLGSGVFLCDWLFLQVNQLCYGSVGRPLLIAFQLFIGRSCWCSATKQKRWSRCTYIQTRKTEFIGDWSTTITVELLAVSLGPFPDSAQRPLCQALYLSGSVALLCEELYYLEMSRLV